MKSERTAELGLARKVIGIFIALICAYAFTSILLSSIDEILFLSRATATHGRVVSFVRVETKNPDHPAYYPRIEFTAKNGETLTFQSQFSLDGRPQSIGDVVPVLYDPDHPKHAQVDAGSDLWVQYGWFCVVGGGFLVGGLLVIRFS